MSAIETRIRDLTAEVETRERKLAETTAAIAAEKRNMTDAEHWHRVDEQTALAELRAELDDLRANQERYEADSRRAEADAHDPQIARRAERAGRQVETRAAEVDAALADLAASPRNDLWTPTLVDLRAMRLAITGQGPARIAHGAVENRSVIASSTVGADDLAIGGQFNIPAPRRLASLFNTVTVAGITSWRFPITTLADSITAQTEGQSKSELDDITEGVATPVTLASFTDATSQAIDTMESLSAFIMNRHLRGLAKSEDALIVDALENATGIDDSSTATLGPSGILQVAAEVEDRSGYPADLVLVNPADLADALGSNLDGNAVTDVAQFTPSIFGLRVYATSAITEGDFMVLSTAAARWVMGSGVSTLVDPYTGAKTNVVTFRSEEYATLAVVDPPAVSLVVGPTGGG